MDSDRRNQTLTLLTGVGIGAALVYLFDPQRGAGRRALIRDQAVKALRTTKRRIGASAKDVTHRAQGALAETRARFGDEAVDDDQLVTRVRAALGHHVETLRALEVTADHGRVTLRGQAPAGEIDSVLAAVRSVRGVADVENQLETSIQVPAPSMGGAR